MTLLGNIPICVGADRAPLLLLLLRGDGLKKLSPARIPLELGGPTQFPGATVFRLFCFSGIYNLVENFFFPGGQLFFRRK